MTTGNGIRGGCRRTSTGKAIQAEKAGPLIIIQHTTVPSRRERAKRGDERWSFSILPVHKRGKG